MFFLFYIFKGIFHPVFWNIYIFIILLYIYSIFLFLKGWGARIAWNNIRGLTHVSSPSDTNPLLDSLLRVKYSAVAAQGSRTPFASPDGGQTRMWGVPCLLNSIKSILICIICYMMYVNYMHYMQWASKCITGSPAYTGTAFCVDNIQRNWNVS